MQSRLRKLSEKETDTATVIMTPARKPNGNNDIFLGAGLEVSIAVSLPVALGFLAWQL